MLVECIISSLLSSKFMKSYRGIGTLICSSLLLASLIICRVFHFSAEIPLVLNSYMDHASRIGVHIWWIVPVALLLSEAFSWLGVGFLSGIKDPKDQTWIGGTIDTIGQLIGIFVVVFYGWIVIGMLLYSISGFSLSPFFSAYIMAAASVFLWVWIVLYSRNCERNMRLYTKYGMDTNFSDVNGKTIRGYDKVSYHGRTYRVMFINQEWILLPAISSGHKEYMLADAADDSSGHLILMSD